MMAGRLFGAAATVNDARRPTPPESERRGPHDGAADPVDRSFAALLDRVRALALLLARLGGPALLTALIDELASRR